MKKYTLALLVLTMFALMAQNVYATEDFITEDVENEATLNKSTYEDEIEVKETGTVTTLRFYACYANGEAAYPVKDVEIEVFYDSSPNGRPTKLNTLNGFSNVSLVSNENGEILLENLPYGMYRYEIKSTPNGLNLSNSKDDSFEVTPFDYEVEKEYYLPIKIAVSGVGYLVDPKTHVVGKDEPPIGFYDPKPTPEVMSTGDDTVITEDVSLDNAEKTNSATNTTIPAEVEEIETTTPIEDYNPTVEQVEVLGDLYESAKTDFTVKEDTEVDIENIPLSATIPVRIEMSKKDAIRAMRQIRITEQIRIATTNMDSTLSELQMLSTKTDEKKE